MHGRISALVVGLGLALGGGIAGAALVGQEPAQSPVSPAIEAELAAAESEKLAQASASHALKVAQRARRIARRARSKSNESLATTTALLDDVDKALADSAESLAVARQAEQDAANALQAANATSTRLDSTQIVSDTANGTTVAPDAGPDYVPSSDGAGPRVTVTVPSSGMIEVWASAFIEDEGAVALYEDGNVVPIPQDQLCTSGAFDDALFASAGVGPLAMSTPPSLGFGTGCGTAGAAGSAVLFNRSPGQHTYELRYGDCGCVGGDSQFSERVLRVAPRL
jgi:multidrug efflux pump subunit AcrA (membrane-fusion protein)